MTQEGLRKSGIAVIGDVPWGTHFCQFYKTKEDLLDLLVPYFKEGLAHNEFCLWVTSEPVTTEEAAAALQKSLPNLNRYRATGQIEIIPYTEWYRKGGTFDADRVLTGWVEKFDQARARGFEGLRLTGNTFWLESKEWKAFTEYEEKVNSIIGQFRMMALCTYSLEKCGASEVIDVVSNHQFALIKREGQWARIQSGEHKRVEAALRESEERFRLAFEQAAVGIAHVSLSGRWLRVNRKLCDIVGYSGDELLARTFQDITHPDDLQSDLDSVRRMLAGEIATYAMEKRYIRKNGSLVWVRLTVSLIRDALGHPEYFISIIEDISVRKQAEEELRRLTTELEQRVVERTTQLQAINRSLENEIAERKQAATDLTQAKERFRSLVETTGDWIWEIDQNGRYTYASPQVKDLLGYEPEDMIGTTPFALMPPEEATSMAAQFRTLLTTHAPITNLTNVNLHKDGRRVVLETSGRPIFDSGGQFLGYRGIDRDITARKQAEESLKNIEWLLTKKFSTEEYAPPYGNLLALNTTGEILRAIGESTLVGIVKSYLDLLGTSAAVYEKNGDYACGIFSSGWCRLMDHASRRLCGTKDNRAALHSGKWLCHESCWNDASKVAMDADRENDVPCKGGIRLYAVPIRAGTEVIGSLNFGYGQPPQDPQKLQELAEAYGVTTEQLLLLSRSHETIPPFILELAKQNAREAAQLIGTMVLRKRAETELLQSQEMLHLIVNNIPLHVFWKDLSLTYRGCNNLFAQAAGLEGEAAVVGKTDFDLAWKETAALYQADDRSVMETKIPKLNFEEPQTRPDGSLLWLRTSKVPLMDHGGQVIGVLGIYEDITVRKELEAQTHRLERLAAMGQLLGGLAHEIRNPLFILTGHLQLFREKLLQQEYAMLPANLQKIESVVDRLKRVTERFLSLARPYQPQEKPSAVPMVLQQTLEFLGNELMKNQIRVETAFAPNLPPVLADPKQLHEVFLHLMINAIQAMVAAHGRGTLTVSAQLSAAGIEPSASENGQKKHWLEVRIQDDGPGINPTDKARLFEPFFSTKPPENGTGLGLWIVRTSLMAMKGTVTCETEVGQGSTFIIRLPVADANQLP